MKILLLSPLYLPPMEYFRKMEEADLVVLDVEGRYDKRFKALHRTRVSNGEGAALLTVPVSTPGSSKCKTGELRVSGHGEWWRVEQQTLATLFGPTPFFNFYKHEVFELLNEKAVGENLTDFNIKLILLIRRFLGISTPMSMTLDKRYEKDEDVEIVDLRSYDFYKDEGARSVIETLFKEGVGNG